MDLVEKILACHHALAAANIPHAFGGALALAWCTASARGTIDVDVNVFAGSESIRRVLHSLPRGVTWNDSDIQRLESDLQQRLWWESTPIDLFLNSTEFHEQLLPRIRWERFAGHSIPFLSCRDLAVFKVFFDRTKDWADLEAMRDAGTLDVEFVAGIISHYLGTDDPRLDRLLSLVAHAP